MAVIDAHLSSGDGRGADAIEGTGTIIETPCIRVCAVDTASGLCSGCGRSLAEIAAWTSLSPTARRSLMADLPARLARLREGFGR